MEVDRVELEFHRLPPRNRCGAAIIAIASLVERLALSVLERSAGEKEYSRSFLNWNSILEHIRDHTPRFKSSGYARSPAEFLEIVGHPISITRKNRESLNRLHQAVNSVIDEYLKPEAPLSVAVSNATDTTAAEDVRFVIDAVDVLSRLRSPGSMQKLLDAPWSDRADDKLVDHVIRELFGDANFPAHPLFRPFQLFDPIIVASEFFGIQEISAGFRGDSARIARASFDLYAIVREARGWSAPARDDVNLVVRDLLWIRNSTETFREYSPDDFESEKEVIGLYVSAIDGECFYLERVELQAGNVLLTGRANELEISAQRVAMIFAAGIHRHDLQIRDGILSGFAGRGQSLGAWKLLLIRPNWSFTRQLTTILAQTTKNTMVSMFDLCQHLKLVGACFSDTLAREYPTTRPRRLAFRRLLTTGTNSPDPKEFSITGSTTAELRSFMVDQVRSDLEPFGNFPGFSREVLRDAILDRTVDAAITAIQWFTQRSWSLIEPAQIMTYRQRPATRDAAALSCEDQRDIASLLDRELIHDVVQDHPNS